MAKKRKCLLVSMLSVLLIILFSLTVNADTIIDNTGGEFNSGTYTRTEYSTDSVDLISTDSIQELNTSDGLFDYSNLVTYYNMNDDSSTISDSSGNGHDITGCVAEANQTGILDEAYRFYDDDCDAGDINALDGLTTLTVCSWANTEVSITASRTLVSKNAVFVLGAGWEDNVASFWTNDGGYNEIQGVNKIPQNEWVFLCGRYNGSHSAIFYNGYIDNIEADTTTLSSNANTLDIGAFAGANKWRGDIDEVTTWSRALSDSEIADLYHRQAGKFGDSGNYVSQTHTQAGATWNNITFTRGYGWEMDTTETGLINPLDYTDLYLLHHLNNDLTDSSGNGYHGTWVNAGTNATGQLDNAMKLDGVDDCYTSTAPNSRNSTIGFWFKPNTVDFMSGDDMIFSKYGGNSDRLQMYMTGTTATRRSIRMFSDTGLTLQSSKVGFNKDDWYHITLTMGDDGQKLYIDGKLDSSHASTVSWDSISSGDLEIGCGEYASTRDYEVDVTMDEVFIYDRALSTSEIENIYTRGATRLNLTVTNSSGSEINIGYSDTFLNLGYIGDNLTYNAYYENDGSNFTPELYNVTIDYTTGGGDTTNPVVTLNSPTNNQNFTVNPITFNCTAYDIINLTNVSLYIDGVLNETNISGINNTDYIFSKTMSEGNHNWTCEAYDNSSNTHKPTALLFNVNTTLPTDSNITNILITDNTCTVSSAFELNGSFDCVGNENCTGSWFFNTSNSAICTIFSGNKNGTFNIANGSSYSTTINYVCSVASDYVFNFTSQNNGDSALMSNITTTCSAVAGGAGLSADESSCLLTGFYDDGVTKCALGKAGGGTMLAIILFVVLLTGVCGFLMYTSEGALKAVFLIGMFLSLTFGLNLLGNITEDHGLPESITNVVWTGYTVSLYIFFGVCLYGLLLLTLNLKARKQKIPNFNSPMVQAKMARKERNRARKGFQ